jgi:hypothetical protein
MIGVSRRGPVKFLGRAQHNVAMPYALHPPYAEARAELLARRPGADDTRPFGDLFAVAVDVGLEHYLLTVYLFADGTISAYSTGGIHSTGLRGAPRVVVAAEAIFDEVRSAFAAFEPVGDVASLPLPERGESQVLVRTFDGDFVLAERLGARHEIVAQIAAMALLLTEIARIAVVEGFDRVEAGEVAYALSEDYRRLRSALMSWIPDPEHIARHARVAGVAVEVGDEASRSITSLFAFADGSTSLFRSDGGQARALSETPGIASASSRLLDAIGLALAAFGPVADVVPLPQPGHVHFVAHARLGDDQEWTELLARADEADLRAGTHPLSEAYGHVTEILRIAGHRAGNEPGRRGAGT